MGDGATIRARVRALREQMKKARLAAYLVPSTDPHQSEYTPAYWQRRQWVSGFTGSVGDLVVTTDQACLWTDSRYFLQAEEQLEGTGIVLHRQGLPGVPSMTQWLAKELAPESTVGVDPKLLSMTAFDDLQRHLRKTDVRLKRVRPNLVDSLWPDRPSRPAGPLWRYPVKYAGQSTAAKLEALRCHLKEEGVDALVMTRLDCVAWAFNLRGSDAEFTPVAIAYGLVTLEDAYLFVGPEQVSAATRRALQPQLTVCAYDEFEEHLRRLGRAKARVHVDPEAATAWIAQALRGAALVRKTSPLLATKARKNRIEIRGAHRAHHRDGIALVRFFCWLHQALGRQRVTEISAAQRLESFRKEMEGYRGPSFNTISAYGSHGAIVHYAPTAASDWPLRRKGLYLLDAGGQYLDGTTDVTRTVLLGAEAGEDHKDHFTRVLKGHIALATARFPAGVSGQRLDAFSRRALWAAGLDYGHGTGHGVGAFLGVHESPPSVAPSRMPTVPLEEGHVLSNEPGYYRRGRYGIRVENLMVVVRDQTLSRRGQVFLRFEPLTLCPIDRRLVEVSLLSEDERQWLNDYHDHVTNQLAPHLDEAEVQWLRQATAPL
jgi:Xaa-Pro aminopeptidase